MSRRTIQTVCVTAIFASMLGSSLAQADQYPSQKINVIVPYSPGGTTDVVARLVIPKMEAILNTTMVIENKPGASGTLGTEQVVTAVPDGYTLLLGSDQAIANGGAENPSYNGLTDLVPIGVFSIAPLSLVAGPGVSETTLAELVKSLKESPQKYTIASAGFGGSGQMTSELLNEAIGSEMRFIPYAGGGQAIQDILGGHAPLLVTTPSIVAQHAAEGKLKILAVFGEKRSSVLPDTATAGEQDVPLVSASFFGLFAPEGTPESRVEVLNDALARVSADPEILAQFAKLGLEPAAEATPEYAKQLASEMDARMRQVFKEATPSK